MQDIVNWLVQFATDLNHSMMERLQKQCPKAHFVKAFSCVGSALMVDPDLPGGPPTMFICGDANSAKKTVEGLLTELGWETEDLGPATSARIIEPLCILWCLPGFLGNGWNHALKLLRK